MFIWTISDAFAVGIIGLLMLCGLWVFLRQWFLEITCKHDGGIGETRSCDAICHKCGKNLGFIGSWRKGHRT